MLLFLVLVAAGLLAGILSGLLGVGGGVLMVPFLTLVAGTAQHEAQAISLLVIVPTSLVATVSLRRKGIGNIRAAIPLGIFGAVAAVAGSFLALDLPTATLRIIFGVFLGLIGLRFIRDAILAKRTPA